MYLKFSFLVSARFKIHAWQLLYVTTITNPALETFSHERVPQSNDYEKGAWYFDRGAVRAKSRPDLSAPSSPYPPVHATHWLEQAPFDSQQHYGVLRVLALMN